MDEIQVLKEENKKLKMINENKSDLVSISAHQIRTSLTALKWTLQMLLNEELGTLNDEQKSYLKKTMLNNEHTVGLVNSLLDLNHSNNTTLTFNFTKVDFLTTLEKVISIFSGEIKNKHINLILNKPEIEIPKINCDEEMIIVVLQNLIENAVKYSNDNTDIKVSLNYNKDENNILISINNQGIGIKKEDQANIFSKFFRASNAIEKDKVGSGFGLFATKNIVDKHNGKIWFESEDEIGTTFSVMLPIS